jgi:hypothetical protein
VRLLRQVIHHFRDIFAPLTDLLRESQPQKVMMTPTHLEAFETLKLRLIFAPCLTLPDVGLDATSTVAKDASRMGIHSFYCKTTEEDFINSLNGLRSRTQVSATRTALPTTSRPWPPGRRLIIGGVTLKGAPSSLCCLTTKHCGICSDNEAKLAASPIRARLEIPSWHNDTCVPQVSLEQSCSVTAATKLRNSCHCSLVLG